MDITLIVLVLCGVTIGDPSNAGDTNQNEAIEVIIDKYDDGVRPLTVIRTTEEGSGITFTVPRTWNGPSVFDSSLHVAGVYSPVGRRYDRNQLRKTIDFEVEDIQEHCIAQGLSLSVDRVEVRVRGNEVSRIAVFFQ